MEKGFKENIEEYALRRTPCFKIIDEGSINLGYLFALWDAADIPMPIQHQWYTDAMIIYDRTFAT